jgi:predicted RNA binding protein YcfA (HicA-like mRNA interferase family)
VSPALPVISGADAVAALTKGGFIRVSQRGSHVKMRACRHRADAS